MAAADEPSSADLEPFDYQRDVEPENEDAAPDRVTAMVRQYVQSTCTSMYVLAVVLGGLLAFSLLIGVLDTLRGVDLASAVLAIGSPIVIGGIPSALLLYAAGAFRRFGTTEEVQHLARGFRVQARLLLLPFVFVALFFAIQYLMYFGVVLVGAAFNG